MSKVAVVYWSGTGNTEAMAQKIMQGAADAGAAVTEFKAAEFGTAEAAQFDSIAFGCPSMGAEQLEETEFQPMWDSVKDQLAGKKVVLFGSWGWGGGAWMDDWKADAEANGVNVVETVLAENAPDETAEAECESAGKVLA